MPIRCATIFSNLGPGDSLAGPGIGIGLIPFGPIFNYAGIAFTPAGQNYTLDSIELPLELISGPSVVDVLLMSDTAGRPGSILESFSLTGALSTGSAALVTFDSALHPTLDAGIRYWVVAAGGPSSFVMWKQNELQQMGPNVSGSDLSSLVRNSDLNVREAAGITGTPIPEPAMLFPTGMLFAAAILIAVYRRMRPHRF